MSSTPQATRRVARALDVLRHGWAIRVEDADGALDLLPAETAFAEAGLAATQMLISDARAVTLKLANQRAAAAPHAPVLIRGAEPFALDLARAIADPALDLRYPLKGPFLAEPILAGEAATTAMELARLAGILPAFLVLPDCEADVVSAADLAAWKNALGELLAYEGATVYGGRGKTASVSVAVKAEQEYLERMEAIITQYVADLRDAKAELSGPNAATHYTAIAALAVKAFPEHALPYLIEYGVYGLANQIASR